MQKPSGWCTHAVSFLRAMCLHVEPVLFVSDADWGAAQQLFSGLPLFRLPVTQQASLSTRAGRRSLASCWWKIRKSQYPQVDLVHSLEAYPTGLVGSWLARRLSRPHALTIHGTYGVVWAELPADRWFYQQVLAGASLICPVSPGTARLVQQYFGPFLAHAHLQPILNGNDFYQSVPPGEALGRVFPQTPTLLTVGDVKPRKGQDLSLAAFARVKEQFPAARYLIAGNFQDNPYTRSLQQFILAHGLRDVQFLGAVTDEELRSLYRSASAFVLTPRQEGLHFEGFGLVYLEAGAYGLPVVGTRTGGVPDAIREGETGLLVDPEDMEGLSAALLQLLGVPDLARKLGQANRRWAEELTWERTAQEQMAAYQLALEGQ